MNEARLLQVIIVEHVHDGVPPDRDILSLTDHVELVNNFLIHEAEWFPGQEAEGAYELLGWYVLRYDKLGEIYCCVRSEKARLCDLLQLANLEEVFELGARVDLAIPQLHVRHDVAVVRESQRVSMALTHTQDVSVHLARHIVVSHG